MTRKLAFLQILAGESAACLAAIAFGYHFHQRVIIVTWAAIIWPVLTVLIVIAMVRQRRNRDPQSCRRHG
jgi:ABC-type Fe3+-siderophore transport system permease subunit